MTAIDPSTLDLDELRARRAQLQSEDDCVSYVRRVAQARLDLVRAERERRSNEHTSMDLPSELRAVLAGQIVGSNQGRAPRPVVDVESNPLADELDLICAEFGFSRLDSLTPAELDVLDDKIAVFERNISADRRARFDLLDALSAELVRRYRDGSATVNPVLR